MSCCIQAKKDRHWPRWGTKFSCMLAIRRTPYPIRKSWGEHWAYGFLYMNVLIREVSLYWTCNRLLEACGSCVQSPDCRMFAASVNRPKVAVCCLMQPLSFVPRVAVWLLDKLVPRVAVWLLDKLVLRVAVWLLDKLVPRVVVSSWSRGWLYDYY